MKKECLTIFLLFMTISALSQGQNLISELKKKIQEKNTSEIISFINKNSQVLKLKDENGTSGFMLILYSNNTDAFDAAIELKKDFDFYDAIVSGKIELVEKFLNSDPENINRYTSDGFTPIALASFFDQQIVAELLLKKGGNPNLKAKNASSVNALHAAVAKENYSLCKLYLEYGTDVNSIQTQKVTALHSAVHRDNIKIVALLLSYGADINLEMENGDTPLIIAKREKKLDIYNLLKRIK